MKFMKPFLLVFFILAIAVLGFILWATSAMGPAPEAFAALRSDAHATVSADKFIVFQSAIKKPTTAFVFYPGARVIIGRMQRPFIKLRQRAISSFCCLYASTSQSSMSTPQVARSRHSRIYTIG